MFSGGRRVHWKRMKNRNQSINFRSNINALTQLCCAYCQGLRKWGRSGKLFIDETLFDVVFSKNCNMTFPLYLRFELPQEVKTITNIKALELNESNVHSTLLS